MYKYLHIIKKYPNYKWIKREQSFEIGLGEVGTEEKQRLFMMEKCKIIFAGGIGSQFIES